MKKSLVAVAVAGLFAAPVAMAEVTLSGAVNLGIEVAKSSGGSAPGSAGSLTRTLLHVDRALVRERLEPEDTVIAAHAALIDAAERQPAFQVVREESIDGHAA